MKFFQGKKMREVTLKLEPFGDQKIKLSGSVVQSPEGIRYLVWAEVLHNPFTPLVSTNSIDARAFAEAILQICDQLDAAERER